MAYAPIATDKARNRLAKKIKKCIAFVLLLIYIIIQKGGNK